MAEAKKKASTKKAPPAFPKRLLTAWKQLGEKAIAGKYLTTSKLFEEEGAALALAEALDGGILPPVALWKLGEQAIDAAPPRVALELLRTVAQVRLSYTQALRLSGALILTRLLEDARSLDAIDTEGSVLAKDLLAMLRPQIDLDSAPLSDEARRALALEWSHSGSGATPITVTDGVAKRGPNPAIHDAASVQSTREFAAKIFGADRLASDLAAAHRERINEAAKVPNGYALYPADIFYLIASEALTPAECAQFQPYYPLLAAVSARWNADALFAFCSAALQHGRRDAALVASTAAVFAIWRDPSTAERFAPFLQLYEMGNQAATAPGPYFATLVKTDSAWLRGYVMSAIFGEGKYPQTYSGPLGIALLTSVDPDEAERLARQHEESIDYTRILGVESAALIALIERARPTVRRGLLLTLFATHARDGDAPALYDAELAFVGGPRDSWIAGYVASLPRERGLAVYERERAAGRESFVRAALQGTHLGKPLLDAVDGAPAG